MKLIISIAHCHICSSFLILATSFFCVIFRIKNLSKIRASTIIQNS